MQRNHTIGVTKIELIRALQTKSWLPFFEPESVLKALIQQFLNHEEIKDLPEEAQIPYHLFIKTIDETHSHLFNKLKTGYPVANVLMAWKQLHDKAEKKKLRHPYYEDQPPLWSLPDEILYDNIFSELDKQALANIMLTSRRFLKIAKSFDKALIKNTLWANRDFQKAPQLKSLKTTTNAPKDLIILPDGRIIIVNIIYDKRRIAFDVYRNDRYIETVETASKLEGRNLVFQATKDGKILIINKLSKNFYLFDVDKKTGANFQSEGQLVSAADLCEGKIVSISKTNDNKMQVDIWNTETGKIEKSFSSPFSSLFYVMNFNVDITNNNEIILIAFNSKKIIIIEENKPSYYRPIPKALNLIGANLDATEQKIFCAFEIKGEIYFHKFGTTTDYNFTLDKSKKVIMHAPYGKIIYDNQGQYNFVKNKSWFTKDIRKILKMDAHENVDKVKVLPNGSVVLCLHNHLKKQRSVHLLQFPQLTYNHENNEKLEKEVSKPSLNL